MQTLPTDYKGHPEDCLPLFEAEWADAFDADLTRSDFSSFAFKWALLEGQRTIFWMPRPYREEGEIALLAVRLTNRYQLEGTDVARLTVKLAQFSNELREEQAQLIPSTPPLFDFRSRLSPLADGGR